MHWLDRITSTVAPRWTLDRAKARIQTDILARHFEAATVGRRTQGWRRHMTDANAANGPSLSTLRDITRDLVRNNSYAESALSVIVDQVVGWGIQPTVENEWFTRWAESTACDAAGRQNLAGLQRLAMRTVVESGEVLIRRLWYKPEDPRLLPFKLQVLEPDFLDTAKEEAIPNGRGRIIQGVEFDASGQRVAYWLFPEHPGSSTRSTSRRFSGSQRIGADEVLHVYRQQRPGQVRAASWFAPTLLTAKDFDELADAKIMQQKIAACLGIATTDVDGLGEREENPDKPPIDKIFPGMVQHFPAGRQLHVIQPPSVRDYPELAKITLQSWAAGVGCSYSDMTGDYTELPFSAARMERLRQWGRVQDWRWGIMVLQLLDPVWAWAREAAEISGVALEERTEWTGAPLPMIEPDKEGLAVQRNIRTGIMSISEAIRERGYNPKTFLAEYKRDLDQLDELGIVLDSDARKMTQAGQLQAAGKAPDVGEDVRELRELLVVAIRELEERPRPRKKRAAAPPAKLNGNGSHDPAN